MAPRARIDLFYDILSPYAWIAFEGLTRYRFVWNIELKLRPFFAPGILKAADNRPIILVPNKFNYMYADLRRLGEYWCIPIKFPKNPQDALLKQGSLACQRFLTSLNQKHPSHLEEASRQLWLRRWSKDESISSAEDFRSVCQLLTIPASDTELIIENMSSETTKAELKRTGDEAIKTGAYGAPWIHVHRPDGTIEPFFGSDRFHVIAHILGEKFDGPLVEKSALV